MFARYFKVSAVAMAAIIVTGCAGATAPSASSQADASPPAVPSATPSASPVATPAAASSEFAVHIVDQLDELARLADAGDGDAVGQWAIAEAPWVTDNMAQLFGDGVMSGYVTNVTALLQAVSDGSDQTDAVATLLGMRNDIAELAGVATLAPTPAPTPTATPKPAPVSYAKLTSRAWKQIVKSPDRYIGKGYQVWACINQFDAATGDGSFLANASYKKQEYWNLYGENAWFNGDASRLSDFVEDDIVVMNVVMDGSYSYDTQAGGNTTVPSFDVKKITRKGSCE